MRRMAAIVRRRRSGGADWTPAALGSSLALWLDAADTSTVTLNGSTVSQWNDKSGNGRNASQVTASAQPSYTLGGLNGRNVLTFSSGRFLSLPATYFPYQSAFIVYSDTATVGFTTPLGGVFSGSAAYHGHTNNTQIFTSSNTAPETLNGSNFANGSSIGNGLSTPRPSTPTIFSFIATAQFPAARRLSIVGADASVPASRAISGLISEVIILAGAASIDDRQNLEGYLAWKWGGL